MDGIRGYWDGADIISRHGKKLLLPQWFTVGLPEVPLDGELWMGLGSWEQLMALLKCRDLDDTKWTQVGYYVFDLPASVAPFSERVTQLKGIKGLPPHVHLVDHVLCTGQVHLNKYLRAISEQGGEGIMVNDPTALYAAFTLSPALLKVKV